MRAAVEVAMFEDLVVCRADGSRVAGWSRPSAARVLCLVLLSPGRCLGRSEAASRLFPALAGPRALNALAKATHWCREALGPELGPALVTDHGTLRWAGEAVVDVAETLGWARGETPVAGPDAVRRVADDTRRLLPAWDDEWLEPFRRDLAAGRRAATVRRATTAEDSDPDEALRCWRRLVGEDPLVPAHQLGLLRALLDRGDRAVARDAYLDLRRLWWRDLRREPDPEIEHLWHTRSVQPAAGQEQPRPPAPAPDPAGLPGLDGRESELTATESHLAMAETGAGATVLVTGPDGSGKSELVRVVVERWRLRGWQVEESTLSGRLLADHAAGRPGRPGRPLSPRRPGLSEAALHGRIGDVLDADATVPLLLVVDDLDRAGASTRRLVRALAGRHVPRRWSLVLASRDREEGLMDAETVALGPLPARVVDGIVRRTHPTLSDELVAVAVHRADGNPLFAREIGRALATSRKGDRRGALVANGEEQRVLDVVGNPAHLAACRRRRERLLEHAEPASAPGGTTP